MGSLLITADFCEFTRAFFLLEVPLSATFFGDEQGEPLNPLAVVRKRVAFACDGGVWFHLFRSSRLRDSRVRGRPTW